MRWATKFIFYTIKRRPGGLSESKNVVISVGIALHVLDTSFIGKQANNSLGKCDLHKNTRDSVIEKQQESIAESLIYKSK